MKRLRSSRSQYNDAHPLLALNLSVCEAPRESLRRRGTILVYALMALLVVSMIGASLARSVVTTVRQLQREQQRMQAGWLAEAGCQRAIFRVQTEPEYQGEEWVVPAEQLQGHSNGLVSIKVETDAKLNSRKNMTVVGTFPADSPQSIRIRRQIAVSSDKSLGARFQFADD